MEAEKRKHSCVTVKNIHETPSNGIYLTKAEAARFCIFGSVVFLILTIFTAFPLKK